MRLYKRQLIYNKMTKVKIEQNLLVDLEPNQRGRLIGRLNSSLAPQFGATFLETLSEI